MVSEIKPVVTASQSASNNKQKHNTIEIITKQRQQDTVIFDAKRVQKQYFTFPRARLSLWDASTGR